MAINQNHLFEELGGTKCSIVEKNVAPGRADFLRRLLEYNRFTVVIVPSPPPPPPKAAPAPAAAPSTTSTPAAPSTSAIPPTPAPTTDPPPPAPPPPETFTVGVTDVMFNATNAIFGRLLKTPDGHTVTLAYWQQKEKESNDDIPYFTS
jgi:hypothetical protein